MELRPWRGCLRESQPASSWTPAPWAELLALLLWTKWHKPAWRCPRLPASELLLGGACTITLMRFREKEFVSGEALGIIM